MFPSTVPRSWRRQCPNACISRRLYLWLIHLCHSYGHNTFASRRQSRTHSADYSTKLITAVHPTSNVAGSGLARRRIPIRTRLTHSFVQCFDAVGWLTAKAPQLVYRSLSLCHLSRQAVFRNGRRETRRRNQL